MMTENSFATEIDWLLSHGWFIFPVSGKIPTVKWTTESSNDPDRIASWFDRSSPPSVGVNCGMSRLVVVDVDLKAGGFETLQSLPPLTATMLVRTGGGGLHYYYRAPEGHEIRNSASRIPMGLEGWFDAPGIDIRAEGGYVVAPPSLHESGNRYRWIGGLSMTRPAHTPDWIRPVQKPRRSSSSMSPAIVGPDRYAEAGLRRELDTVRHAAAGTRNETLNRSSFNLGQLVGAKSISRSLVEELLLLAAAEVGLDAGEAVPVIQRGLDAGEINPRSRT